MMNLIELKRIMSKTLDEVTILELLDIHADELVEAFSDKIEERHDYIVAQLELEESADETDLDFSDDSDS